MVYAAAERAGLCKKIPPHWLRHPWPGIRLDYRPLYLHVRPTDSVSLYLPDESVDAIRRLFALRGGPLSGTDSAREP